MAMEGHTTALLPFNASYATLVGPIVPGHNSHQSYHEPHSCHEQPCSSSRAVPFQRWRLFFGRVGRVLRGRHQQQRRPRTRQSPVKVDPAAASPSKAAAAAEEELVEEICSKALVLGEDSCLDLLEQQRPVQHARHPLRALGRLLHKLLFWIPGTLGPKGPGDHDKTMWQRAANVATCLPFLTTGRSIVRACASVAGKRFGVAFIAVGVVATVYHGSWGRFRSHARKLDYWAIAASSLMLCNAVLGPMHPAWVAAAVLAIPFKPSAVSSAHFALVELKYVAVVLQNRGNAALVADWARHAAVAASATVCFSLDHHPLLSWCPFVHAAFHGLSAAGFMTLASIIAALEAAPVMVPS